VVVTRAVAEGQHIWSGREALAAMFKPSPVLFGTDIEAVAVKKAGTTAMEDLAMAATAALEASGPWLVACCDSVHDEHWRRLAAASTGRRDDDRRCGEQESSPRLLAGMPGRGRPREPERLVAHCPTGCR